MCLSTAEVISDDSIQQQPAAWVGLGPAHCARCGRRHGEDDGDGRALCSAPVCSRPTSHARDSHGAADTADRPWCAPCTQTRTDGAAGMAGLLPSEVVAITFTRKSAAELKARIRHRLAQARAHPPSPEDRDGVFDPRLRNDGDVEMLSLGWMKPPFPPSMPSSANWFNRTLTSWPSTPPTSKSRKSENH